MGKKEKTLMAYSLAMAIAAIVFIISGELFLKVLGAEEDEAEKEALVVESPEIESNAIEGEGDRS